jgi:hypothetical protein
MQLTFSSPTPGTLPNTGCLSYRREVKHATCRQRRTWIVPLMSATALTAATNSASAGPDATVTTAAEPNNPIDLKLELDYSYSSATAHVRRESTSGVNPKDTQNDPVWSNPDLKSAHSSHLITPRLELGLFHDFWLAASLPITISERRTLSLDGQTRGVTSSFGDGILPSNGFDANDPTTGLPDGDLVFRGVSRSGLDQLWLGMGVAPMNQQKDDTKPTWKVGIDVGLPIGKTARFSRTNPSSEAGVGSGVFTISAWTSVTKRMGRAEPFFGVWWQAPLASQKDSLFTNPGFGATNVLPPQKAGARFGSHVYLVDKPADHFNVTLGVEARSVVHFEGRSYTEMWEAFAFAGDANATGDRPLLLDGDPTMVGLQALSHPGITNTENYLELGGRFELRAGLGNKVHLGFVADIFRNTAHAITFADAGVDAATCGGSVTSNCENDNNDVVNPGTNEVNPQHVPLIDLVGHRYLSTDSTGVVFTVQATAVF